MLAERDFRRFYTGYATSRLGSAMSTVALTFAVLGSGGTATDLGYVFAAGSSRRCCSCWAAGSSPTGSAGGR